MQLFRFSASHSSGCFFNSRSRSISVNLFSFVFFSLLGCLSCLLLWGCEISPWSNGGTKKSTVPKGSVAGSDDTRKESGQGVGKTGAKDDGARSSDDAREGSFLGGKEMGMRGSKREKERDGSGSTSFDKTKANAPVNLDKGATKEGVPWIGGKNAKVKIEVFSDFACPYCRVGARIVHKLLESYGKKIKILYYQTPIPGLYPDSFSASQASLAALEQGKFWPMHNLLYDNPRAHSRKALVGYAKRLGLDVKKFAKALDSGKYAKRVRAQMAMGKKRGVEGTPTFFVNGQKIEGAAPINSFEKLIDANLTKD